MGSAALAVWIIAAAQTSGGVLAADEPHPLPFEIVLKREDDRAEAKVEKGRATIAIRSPFGISGAKVERTGERWPESVTLRLHLKGLERFSVKTGETAIEAAVASTDLTPRVRCWKAGAEESPLDPADPFRLDVRLLDARGQEVEELLDVGGCFEIGLPKALFEKNPPSIELAWIDFYRG